MIHVAVGIIQRSDKILIAERPISTTYAGYWEFPGGKIEGDETPESALKRELFEELGIEVSSSRLLFEHSHLYPDKTVLLKIHLVQDFQGEPYGKEGQLLRWVTFAELSQHRILEGNKPILGELESFLRIR